MSSKPATLTSAGTRRPSSCSARSTPSAIWSLATKTAVASAGRSWASACPERALQSPSKTVGARAPAATSVSRQPRTRSCASSQSGGPETCQTVRWPSASRWRGDGLGAGALIDGDQRDVVLRAGLGGDDRQPRRQPVQGAGGRLLRRDHEHAVHPLVAQPVDRAVHVGGRQLGEARDRDRVAGVVGRPLDPGQRRGGAEERGVERDDAERPRAPGDQRARHPVGAVAQLADGVLDALAGRGAHMRAVVEHARDGLLRDPASRATSAITAARRRGLGARDVIAIGDASANTPHVKA